MGDLGPGAEEGITWAERRQWPKPVYPKRQTEYGVAFGEIFIRIQTDKNVSGQLNFKLSSEPCAQPHRYGQANRISV